MTDADPTRRARVEAWNGWIDDHRSHGSVTRELMAAWDAAWTAASAALSAELAEAKAEVERLRKNRNECHRAEVHYLRRLTDAETERDEARAALAALREAAEAARVALTRDFHDGPFVQEAFDVLRAALAADPSETEHHADSATTDEREATPDEAHDIGYVKGHTDGYREARAALASRPAPTVSGERGDLTLADAWDEGWRACAGSAGSASPHHNGPANPYRTVADAPAADDPGGWKAHARDTVAYLTDEPGAEDRLRARAGLPPAADDEGGQER